MKHTVAFDVFMDPDGLVEHVALRSSTLHADEVEACMQRALGAFSERTADLSLRRREPAAPASLPPEGRALLGNPVAIAVGAVEVALVIGFMVVTVVVYYQVVRNALTHRPPPAVVEEPPTPEPPKPETQAQGDPKTTDPPPPPPPPPPRKETCEEEMAQVIRCDDPKIRWYTFPSESAAFKSIKGKDLRKEKAGARAYRGPCEGRGGFHTNVRQGKDYVASIAGCNCCDDSTGRAVEKQRATVIYH